MTTLTVNDLNEILNSNKDTVITVQQGQNGIYFTYVIRPTSRPYAKDIVLYHRIGLDTAAHKYIGTIYTDKPEDDIRSPRAVYPRYRNNEYKYWPPSVKMIDALIDHLAAGKLGPFLVYKCVRCKFCGKMLTQPQSIIAGAGPGCEKVIAVKEGE